MATARSLATWADHAPDARCSTSAGLCGPLASQGPTLWRIGAAWSHGASGTARHPAPPRCAFTPHQYSDHRIQPGTKWMWTNLEALPPPKYLSGTPTIAPTRWVFGGGCHCCLICVHRVFRRYGYVGYIRKAFEKSYSEHPGLHAGLTICLRFSSVLDDACVAHCLILSTGSYHVFRPFLTDFKKYSHPPPPKGNNILAHWMKSSKTPGKMPKPTELAHNQCPREIFPSIFRM